MIDNFSKTKSLNSVEKKFNNPDTIEELIYEKPEFIVKNGNLFLLLFTTTIIIAAYIIEYPDIVKGRGYLTTINAPKKIIALSSGRLTDLMVTQDQLVEEDEIIGFIESIADHRQVLSLLKNLNTVRSEIRLLTRDRLNELMVEQYSELGEVQVFYQSFRQAYLTYLDYLPGGIYIKEKHLLEYDAGKLSEMHENLLIQKKIHEKDLGLLEETFKANQYLKSQGVISEFDYRVEESKLLNKRLSVPQIGANIINNERQMNDKLREIFELENDINQQKILFDQALNTIISQLEDWKSKYIFYSPVDGRVAFSSFIQKGQQLNLGDLVCYVHPSGTIHYAEITIPQTNLGKVMPGHQVLLKFDSYPYREFGYVKGKIDQISGMPTESSEFIARVNLTDGLVTSNGFELGYKGGLEADVEIITANRRFLLKLIQGLGQ